MNWSNLAIGIAIIFSISGSFGQAISTSGTPSQEGFEAGLPHTMPAAKTPYQDAFSVGLNQPKSISLTPSQARFGTDIGRTTPATESNLPVGAGVSKVRGTTGFNMIISKVIKEGDALHVLVANNGTTPSNITGWMLTLNNGTTSKYIFPSFILQPASVVTIHTHSNVNTGTDLYGSKFMWNGTRDVELLDPNGKLMNEYILPGLSMKTGVT